MTLNGVFWAPVRLLKEQRFCYLHSYLNTGVVQAKTFASQNSAQHRQTYLFEWPTYDY